MTEIADTISKLELCDFKSVTSSDYYPVFSHYRMELKRTVLDDEELSDDDYVVKKSYFTSITTGEPDRYYPHSIKELLLFLENDGEFNNSTKYTKCIDAIKNYIMYIKMMHDITKTSKFEGYLLDDGTFVPKDDILIPESCEYYPFRHDQKKLIHFINDKNGVLQKDYDPYVHGLKLKK
jgi:hypothetical protein